MVFSKTVSGFIIKLTEIMMELTNVSNSYSSKYKNVTRLNVKYDMIILILSFDGEIELEEYKAMKILTVIGLTGFIISIILISQKIIKKDKSKISLKIAIPICTVFFVLFVIGICNLPIIVQPTQANRVDTEEYSKLEKLVASAFPNGRISISGDVLTITYTDDILGEGRCIVSVDMHVRSGLQKIYKHIEFEKYDTVIIKAMTKMPPRSATYVRELGMSLTFDQSALEEVDNFYNVKNDQLILLQGKHKTYINPDIMKRLDSGDIKELFPNN